MEYSKKVITCIALLFLSTICSSQKVSFTQYKDWNSLIAQAVSEEKVIFVFFHAPWCAPCREIEKKIFTDSSVCNLLNSQALNISINIEDSLMLDFVKKYRILSVPSIVVLNNKGFLVKRDQQLFSNDKQKFYVNLKEAIEMKSIIPGFSNSLKINYPDFYNKYFQSLGKIEPRQDQVDEFIANQNDLYSEISWNVLSVFSYNLKNIQIMLDHFTEFEKLYGKEVGDKISDSYVKLLRSLVNTKDSSTFSKLLNVVSKRWDEKAKEEGKYFQWTQFLGRTSMDWIRFEKLVSEYNIKHGDKNNFSFCEVMYKSCFDKKICAYMSTLMEPIVKKERSPKNYIIYGALLLKSGKEDIASEYFSNAIESGKSIEERETWRNEVLEIKKSLVKN